MRHQLHVVKGVRMLAGGRGRQIGCSLPRLTAPLHNALKAAPACVLCALQARPSALPAGSAPPHRHALDVRQPAAEVGAALPLQRALLQQLRHPRELRCGQGAAGVVNLETSANAAGQGRREAAVSRLLVRCACAAPTRRLSPLSCRHSCCTSSSWHAAASSSSTARCWAASAARRAACAWSPSSAATSVAIMLSEDVSGCMAAAAACRGLLNTLACSMTR